ncbi:hypothetical protein DL89DRAFT_306295 [Linderina pennispora]|uniref:Uncharacterized protein n=1 Tax=Linderina pennispora TaxID=61395 RepID=A0A1Y1VSU2_9FUNG|nr:uncharacterized protein DL89DRAFT_306295 [Linderina pennispora]ORX63824.1 hypothetical protein DL89DRAFT_306295 [Linderina pennispora]
MGEVIQSKQMTASLVPSSRVQLAYQLSPMLEIVENKSGKREGVCAFTAGVLARLMTGRLVSRTPYMVRLSVLPQIQGRSPRTRLSELKAYLDSFGAAVVNCPHEGAIHSVQPYINLLSEFAPCDQRGWKQLMCLKLYAIAAALSTLSISVYN